MPRRAAFVLPEIPLFLIPPVIQREICRAGEELERIVIKKTGRHYYNISIRTRSVNRELRAGAPEHRRAEA